MEGRITFEPLEILTDCEDYEGCLVFADGKLVAVLVRLSDPVYDRHLRGSWYLEASFGAALEMRHDVFTSLDEAARVIGAELTKPSGERAFH